MFNLIAFSNQAYNFGFATNGNTSIVGTRWKTPTFRALASDRKVFPFDKRTSKPPSPVIPASGVIGTRAVISKYGYMRPKNLKMLSQQRKENIHDDKEYLDPSSTKKGRELRGLNKSLIEGLQGLFGACIITYGTFHAILVHHFVNVIACLDVRTNDKGDLVVTKGDQYDVREHTKENEVRNLGKPVDLAGQYYKDGADEVKTGKTSLEQISRVYGNQVS
ncbi:hypothetical protein JHK85_050555 [Glycine max]|nr:hypothetical protein JHK85_050555 [Glycine max]